MAGVLSDARSAATTASSLASLAEETKRGRDGYARFLKPRVQETLSAVGLDLVYERAEGDFVFYRDGEDGPLVEVLDFLGGFGASFLGHNHPELARRMREVLDEKRPFNMQASVRALAGRLAERLSEVVGRSTGRAYVVTLASTGTEAVEAAIKHAEMDLVARIDAIVAGIAKTRKEFNLRARAGTAHLPPRTLETAARILGAPIKRADELFARVEEHATLALQSEPAFLTLQRGFHGKSTGSLSLTANPEYREAWRRIGLRTVFLDPTDEAALARAIDAARVPYLDVRIAEGGALEIEQRTLVNVTACFLEPIQGEGGVRPIPVAFARAVRDAADRAGFPIVLDEIQSGFGRTGTFLASESYGIRGDYYLLSKSLGGGLAKISALMIERDRYIPRFGMLHTSTFAEDDASSAIALAALDLLDRDDGALIRGARAKGEHLRKKLEEVRARHPGGIAEVRGMGLMIGIELADTARSPSTFLRVASEQGLLGYLAAAYMLHEERIRVMPTLSSPRTIRVQPSAYVTIEQLDRFALAVERLARALESRDTDLLARHLVGRARTPTQSPTSPPAGEPPQLMASGSRARRIAFLGHFLEPEDVRDWDPGFARLSDPECEKLLDRTRRVLDPFVQHAATIRSKTGDEVDVTVIGVPFTSAQVMNAFRTGDVGWARAMIDDAIAIAKRRGARVIGFGGYTSIVTDNCREVVDDECLVTSGNSLTSAATVDAVLRAKERIGVGGIRLGVVGALGNIGAVLAELLAEHVDSMVLVGRPGAERRLIQREDALYASVLRRVLADGDDRGIARAIFRSPIGAAWKSAAARDEDIAEMSFVDQIAASAMKGTIARAMDDDGGRALGAMARAGLGDKAPITIATDMRALRTCNVIVAATNAPHPVITADHLGEGPVVVCDVAAPGDVHPDVAHQRRDVAVLKGGMVRLPLGQALRVRGMPIAPGTTFGCLGETILMGLSGIEESLSVGALTAAGVRRARDLALLHGFGFDEKPFT